MKQKNTYPIFSPSGCLSSEGLKRAAFGKLNPKEQQQLDLHLESCELCSDALKGIQLVKAPDNLDKALSAMRQKIVTPNHDRTKKSSKKELNTVILAVAASVVLLMGIWFLINYMFRPAEKVLLASQQINTELPTLPSMPKGNAKSGTENFHSEKLTDKAQKKSELEEKKNLTPSSKALVQKPPSPGNSKTIHSFYDETKNDASIQKAEKTTDIASTQPIEVYYAGMEVTVSSNTILNDQAPDLTINQTEKTLDKDLQAEHFFSSFDQMAYFQGGEKKFKSWLSKNINYPKPAALEKIQGTVYLSFIIETNGKISNVLLRRGIGGGCDEESVKVISQMPPWNPALKDGQPVRVLMFLPIRFQLQ